MTARTPAGAASALAPASSPAPPPSAAPLLRARGLHVRLGGVAVLADLNLTVSAGEVVGMVGPNGAGKSTFVRAATALVPLEAGSVQLSGEAVPALSRQQLARRVAVVQQLPEAPRTMRVRELVLLGRHPHLGLFGRESRRDHDIVNDAMERAGCRTLAERTLHTLSGGERRRAFVARALAQQSALLLLDEPTANLDVEAQAQVFQLLRELARDGVGVLVIVHDLTLAGAYCDRVALLDAGRLVAEGTPAEVLTPAIVRRVYGDRVEVIAHPRTGAPLIVPAADQPAAAHAASQEDLDG